MLVPLIIPRRFNNSNRRLVFKVTERLLPNPELDSAFCVIEGFRDLLPGSRVAVEVGWNKERENLVAKMVIV